ESLDFFRNIRPVYEKLKMLDSVGLGYIRLGQSSTTLSGGEAQRIKLARELSKRNRGRTLYILDEPTTGLHFEDVKKLMDVVLRLRDQGNTVIVIEHNLEVIKMSDYIIDLGPEGGKNGGYVLFQGTPEEIISVSGSSTGEYLSPKLKKASGGLNVRYT
ncbi:MAG: ATP-binding cassette domain-containing protein, partial [Oligoflexia bacterium]|nr:ATP-binding cassette domain-containing protein [Oligoflexia bacterium]